MKAYRCFIGCPLEGTLLVYAEDKNKARARAQHGPYDWEGEYIYISAQRQAEWDHPDPTREIVETNEDLVDGLPPFYYEETDWESRGDD